MSKNASHTPSFIIVITYYKSGCARLHAFKFFLKNYTMGVPNRIAILQDWTHQSFISCFFYLLGTRIYVSPQKSKGPVSLSANIAYMCKSFAIVTPRYLVLSTFSMTVRSKVYEAWIFLIRFLVSCIILHLTG